MTYAEKFLNVLKNRETQIHIEGGEFLLYPSEDSLLTYTLNYLDKVVTISATYVSSFDEVQSGEVLKKRCVLNQTFKDISVNMMSDCEIGVESLEYGKFEISTKNAVDLSLTDEDYTDAIVYMLNIIQIISIVENISNA